MLFFTESGIIMAEKNNADIGFEKQIWDAACVLWGHIPAAESCSVRMSPVRYRKDSDSVNRLPAGCRSPEASDNSLEPYIPAADHNPEPEDSPGFADIPGAYYIPAEPDIPDKVLRPDKHSGYIRSAFPRIVAMMKKGFLSHPNI